MSETFVLTAKRSLMGPQALTVAYPSKDLALSAAEIFKLSWPIITITAPDGATIEHAESPT